MVKKEDNNLWRKIERKKWFRVFKENPLKLDIENRIELGRFCYEKDFGLSTWVIGIGIVLFLSVNLSDISNLPKFFYISGIIAYILSGIFLVTGVVMLVINISRQKIKMSYLYKNKSKKQNKK